jgi:hypothetical protein
VGDAPKKENFYIPRNTPIRSIHKNKNNSRKPKPTISNNMIHKLIKTENYLLVVDESEIKKGDLIYCDKFALDSYKHDAVKHIPLPIVTTCFEKYDCDIWFYYDDKKYEAEGGFNTTVFKIIYHLPINNSPILEGVPLLPPLEDEVEKLAEIEFPNPYIVMEGLDISDAYRQGFVVGYNNAKEKYKYTEEDLVWAIQEAYGHGRDEADDILYHQVEESIRVITKYLQQPKYPVEFESEDEVYMYSINGDTMKPKTTTNSQGQTVLVGTYKYE